VTTIVDMQMFAAEVWTYWISFFIIALTVLMCLGLGVAYLVKVVSLKYPKQ
jgi:hypothetical protein